jgi:type IV secretory pathway VirB6-like protein
MLKFLENLPTYLYAIFTTQNEHLVLSTIKSRLQICKVFADNKNLNDLNLNPDEMKIFTFVFDDINDGKNNLENNFFNTALQNAKTIIKNEINKIFQIFA